MAKSALERLKQLDQERRRILDKATKEAMSRAQEAIEALASLGRRFRLVEESNGAGRRGKRQVKDAPCKICGYKTIPPHDARRHRAQKTKKPFSNDELQAMGLRKA